MSSRDTSLFIQKIETELAELTEIPKQRCMYKVHKQLREVSEKAYKPVLLAIGPYYNQDEVGQGFMKEHKLRYLQQMINGTEGSVETYFKALREKEIKIRKYYLECNRQTSDELVKMMLLDGCFVIELFRKYEIYRKKGNEAHRDDPIFRMKWVLPRIARDLLLFENQLPFFVLAKLFGMSERGSSRTSLNVLALRFFSNYLPFRWNVDATNYNSKESKHKIENLLCVMHKTQTLSLRKMVMARLKLGFRIKNEDHAYFKHLLGLVHASISISILDTEINNAIEPYEEEMTEICKHVFCLISEAVIRLLAKIKNNRLSELKKARVDMAAAPVLPRMAAQMNDCCAIEEWERELIPVHSELKEARVDIITAAELKDDVTEIKGRGSDHGYSEDNMPKIDQDRERELISVRSALKKVRVKRAAAPVHEIKGWVSDDGYSEDNMPETDQDREMELSPVRSNLKKVGVKSAAAPARKIEGCGSDDGYFEDNMPKTDQDWESTVLGAAPMNDGNVIREIEKYRVLGEHSEDNMPKTNQDREVASVSKHNLNPILPLCKAAAPTNNGSSVSRAIDECGVLIEHSEDNIPKTDQDRKKKLIQFLTELEKAKVKSQMVEEFKKDFYEIKRWEDELNAPPFASDLFEAGIELEKAKKFMDLVRDHQDQMSVPYRKFLREAGIETKKARKFMDLLDLKGIEAFNIHTATELEEAGIEFKKSTKDKKSKEEKMFCIKFNKAKGKMEVSPLSIEDQTESCFRNLIAYEQYSCDGDNDLNYITDYVSFIDSLIDSPKDVQLLRDRGIIQNYLGDDEVISKMVNKLVHNINLPTSIYARTSKNMNMHCRKLWPKWKAKLRHDYFNTPWAWISFLAAVLLLGLTIVQTIFSIIS